MRRSNLLLGRLDLLLDFNLVAKFVVKVNQSRRVMQRVGEQLGLEDLDFLQKPSQMQNTKNSRINIPS